MDGEGLLRRRCESLGLDFETLFYIQESRVAIHPGKKIVQSYTSNRIEEKDYIVRYFPDNDIYFVWYHIRNRNSCSYGVPKDFFIKPGEIFRDTKSVWGIKGQTEPVFAFYSKDLDLFLKKYVIDGEYIRYSIAT